MKNSFRVISVMAILAISISALFAEDAQRSYFISANGNDSNNGRSAEASFKTLQKALDMSAKGSIKRITILGSLDGVSEGSVNQYGGVPGGAAFVIQNMGDAEIVITGKSAEEKAILTYSGSYPIVLIKKSKIRFENINITGNKESYGLKIIDSSYITFGSGVVISENGSIEQEYSGGIRIENGTITMLSDAIIKNNANSSNGSGIAIEAGNLIMNDDSIISGNQSLKNGGGVYLTSSGGGYLQESSIVMNGKSRITGNTAKTGGGIYAEGQTTFIILNDDSSVTNNKATENGGGIYISTEMNSRNVKQENHGIFINGNAKISENYAVTGGGLCLIFNSVLPFTMSSGLITQNKAEYGAGVYFIGKKQTPRGASKSVISGDTFVFAGGSITDNEAEFVGGGVYIAEKSFFNKGKGTFSGNKAGDGEGVDIFQQ